MIFNVHCSEKGGAVSCPFPPPIQWCSGTSVNMAELGHVGAEKCRWTWAVQDRGLSLQLLIIILCYNDNHYKSATNTPFNLPSDVINVFQTKISHDIPNAHAQCCFTKYFKSVWDGYRNENVPTKPSSCSPHHKHIQNLRGFEKVL